MSSKAFPPHALHDYALLADGERGALIGPGGAVNWLCAPAWHDDAIFASLIGGSGFYAVTPRGRWVPGGYYEDGTLIWRSRWITTDGVIECREALAFPGEQSRLVLLRQLVAVDATAHVRVVLDPRADYGRAPLSHMHRDDDGVWHLKTGPHHLRWQGAPAAVVRSEGLITDLTLKPGESHDLVLECSRTPMPHGPPAAEQCWPTQKKPGVRPSPRRNAPSLPVTPDAPTSCCAV
ncbi:trehalase-like domain-containing protein [Streptomyces sp. NPDC004596]